MNVFRGNILKGRGNTTQKRFICYLLPLILIIGYAIRGVSQPNFRFRHLTTEDGLSQNSVLAIAQDNDGFIWIGTQSGLNRYDGYRVKSFYQSEKKEGLQNDYILSLYQDPLHRLWIGTANGLHLYHSAQESFSSFTPYKDHTSSDIITAIIANKQKNLWIGTKNGLFRFYPSTGRFQKIILDCGVRKDRSLFVNDIYIDHQQNIWVATSEGLLVLQETAEGSVKLIHTLLKFSSESQDAIATSIVADNQGFFWLGTMNNGLFKLNEHAEIIPNMVIRKQSPIDNHIRKIANYPPTTLLIATQGGLFSLYLPTQTITPFKHSIRDPKSLGKNSLYSLFRDKDGTLWVGSYFGGVSIASTSYSQFYTWPGTDIYNEIDAPVISGIAKDGAGNLWMSSEGNGLIKFNPDTKTYQVFTNEKRQLSTNLLKTVFLDNNGLLWMGTHGGGINTYNLAQNNFTHYPITGDREQEKNAETYCITVLTDNRLLFGGNYGVKTARIYHDRLDSNSLKTILSTTTRSFLQVANGDVYIGTVGGLYCLSKGKVDIVKDNLNINCLCLSDNKRQIWIGTKKGFFSYDITRKQLTPIHSEEIRLSILAINKDSTGNIWLSSENGLYCINVRNRFYLSHYLIGDGIANNQFNYKATTVDNSGRLFFGGNEGLTYFYPQDIKINNAPSHLVVTDITVLDTALQHTSNAKKILRTNWKNDDVALNFKQTSFTVNFALLNYIHSDKNHYLYQLEGYDKSWRTSDIPSATYINLPYGHFRLHIKGFNNDNVPSAEKMLSITIRPPFWETWWAYSIYCIVLLALVFGTIRYFVLRVFYKKEQQANKSKLDFFANISHEIRTHLTLIIAPLSNLLNKEQPKNTHQVITQVESNANHLMTLVNELLDFRRMESGKVHLNIVPSNINDFLTHIYSTFVPVAEARHIDFTYMTALEGSAVLYFDKAQMEKVLFNLLSNAFKFTPDEGRIELSLRKEDRFCTITVSDDGKGIAPQYKDKIFENYYQITDASEQNTGYGIGLALSKQIVALHHGKIFLSRPKNKLFTTAFTVQLPLGNHHFKINTSANTLTNNTSITATPPITQTLVVVKEDKRKDKDIDHAHKTQTLLLVEDNQRMQTLLVDILSPYYHIITAGNAEVGLRKSSEKIPDLIISDVMMPGMSGFEFCTQLRQDIATSHIPIILLTAKNATEDYITGLDSKADIYLTKPFNAKILLLHIDNLLKRQEQIQKRILGELLKHQESSDNPLSNDNPGTAGLRKQDAEFLQQLRLFIDEHLENPDLGVQMLAKEYNMSAPVLYKKLQALTGSTIHEFIKIQKLHKACQLLKDGVHNITEIAYMVGYSDRKYFSKEFKKYFGVNPSDYPKEKQV
ncbi:MULTISPECIES: hybrid sensor histidine kinase/response regulator transcription factor [Chitinophagaceae]